MASCDSNSDVGDVSLDDEEWERKEESRKLWKRNVNKKLRNEVRLNGL